MAAVVQISDLFPSLLLPVINLEIVCIPFLCNWLVKTTLDLFMSMQIWVFSWHLILCHGCGHGVGSAVFSPDCRLHAWKM